MNNYSYRPDIDGLRAIAVILVILFHYYPDTIKGGFIGVDIFFVISGYLISKNIFQDINKNRYRLVTFTVRRINRIFPALIVILIFSMILGWFVLLAHEYKQLGKHIFTGGTFTSNIAYWRESGYFDNFSETKPLLHLWSLGVEEQFYILFPFLIFIIRKFNINKVKLIIGMVIFSFYLNIRLGNEFQVLNFYLPIGRMWEMLVGSLLALYAIGIESKNNKFRHKNINQVLYALAVIILIFAILIIDNKINYPGYWVILPVFSCVLFIYAGRSKEIRSKVISNKYLVWIGLISYPLYLWHWPLYSFARIIAGDTLDDKIKITLIILSIVLGFVTYRFVELPIKNKKSAFKTITLILIILLLFTSLVGLVIYLKDGLPNRTVVKNNIDIKSGEDGGYGTYIINSCGLDDLDSINKIAACKKDSRGPSKYALLGDSKAAALFPGLVRTSTANGRWLFIGDNGPNGPPLPVISNEGIYKKYQELTTSAVNAIANNKEVDIVVLTASARLLFQLSNDKDINDLPDNKNYESVYIGLLNTVNIFIKAKKKVVLVIDNPTLPYPEDCLYRKTDLLFLNKILVNENSKCELDLTTHYKLSKKYRNLLYKIQAKYPKDILVFDTVPLLCDLKNNKCSHRKNGKHLYMFTDHISDYAAGNVGSELNKLLDNIE